MRMKRVLLATTMLALLAGAGQAQAGGMYVNAFGGVNWLVDSSAARTEAGPARTWTWSTEADTGFVVGGGVGTHLDNWSKGLRVELETSYRRNDVAGDWTVTLGAPASGAIDANISTHAVLANIWYECDMGWKAVPYLGGGGGWGRANLVGAVDGVSFDVDNNGFVWQLGAGVNHEVSPGVVVGLGYRYFRGPDVTDPFSVGNGVAGFRSFGRIDNESHAVSFNLTVGID